MNKQNSYTFTSFLLIAMRAQHKLILIKLLHHVLKNYRIYRTDFLITCTVQISILLLSYYIIKFYK